MDEVSFSVQKIPETRIFMHLENQKEQVDFPSWEKLDLRVGKILKVSDIPDADKLYKLEVDVGASESSDSDSDQKSGISDKKITLVAGLKKNYKPKQLIGKQVIVLANLEPRKFKEIESQGMVLAAVNEDESKIVLIQPEDEIEEGSKIR